MSKDRIGKGKPGPGRKKGSKSKYPTQVKELVRAALEGAHPDGSLGYLIEQARRNPVAFLGLLNRLIPRELDIQVEHGLTLKLDRSFVKAALPEGSAPQIIEAALSPQTKASQDAPERVILERAPLGDRSEIDG